MPEATHGPPDALAPPPGNPRFPLFDGLRAIAALSVLLFHAAFLSGASLGTSGLAPYLARLNVGVAVFFVISGFLLYRPLLAARVGSGPPVRLRDYARRRVLRIVPAYWVALTVLAIYPGLYDVFTGHWWIYYGFGQGYGQTPLFGGITVAWTLGCEVVFYVLLPFLSLGLDRLARATSGRRLRWRVELSVLGVLCAASAAYRVLSAAHPQTLPFATFASTFAWFALGMLLAVLSVAGAERRTPAARALARHAWWGWPVAVVAYVVLCRGLGLYSGNPFREHDKVGQVLAIYALSGVVAAGLALPAVFAPGRRAPAGGGIAARALGIRALAWLGLISYGIYLYHYPILNQLNSNQAPGARGHTSFLVLVAAGGALAVCAGALSYYLVERPSLRFKDRRRSRAAQISSVSPAAPR